MIRTLVVGFSCLCLASPPNLNAEDAAVGIGALSWLAGCWQAGDAEQLSEECWLGPRGGLMLGLSRTSSPTGVSFEFLRISEDDGGVTYWASPSGREPTPFRATEISHQRVTFSNPEHDFPQRIAYWREGGRLHARVEAESNGEMKGFDLEWDASPTAW